MLIMVNRKLESPTKTMDRINAQLYSTKLPFPMSRRQNHSRDILVKQDDKENIIWKQRFSFWTVTSRSNSISQTWRFMPQCSVAIEVTAAIAIAKIRPMTIKTSSIPALHVILSLVYRRRETTRKAQEKQTIFTMRTPCPRVGGSI
jgi:hypothetical protein